MRKEDFLMKKLKDWLKKQKFISNQMNKGRNK